MSENNKLSRCDEALTTCSITCTRHPSKQSAQHFFPYRARLTVPLKWNPMTALSTDHADIFWESIDVLIHSSLWPSDARRHKGLGGYGLRYWLVAWRHQTITWTNADLSPKVFCGIYANGISQELLKLIFNICWDSAHLKLLPHHLISQGPVSLIKYIAISEITGSILSEIFTT